MSASPGAATALVVVDVQEGTKANARAFSDPAWLDRAAALVDAFHDRALPVVIATSLGTPAGRTTYGAGGRDWPDGATELLPEITATDGDLKVARRAMSVFAVAGLADQLSQAGITDLVIVGIATSFGVESTARAAYDLGFSVIVAADAVADLQSSSHEHALTAVLPAIGRVMSTEEILALIPSAAIS